MAVGSERMGYAYLSDLGFLGSAQRALPVRKLVRPPATEPFGAKDPKHDYISERRNVI